MGLGHIISCVGDVASEKQVKMIEINSMYSIQYIPLLSVFTERKSDHLNRFYSSLKLGALLPGNEQDRRFGLSTF